MESVHLEDVHLGCYLVVNKLITEKNICNLTIEHIVSIKYSLNKLFSKW